MQWKQSCQKVISNSCPDIVHYTIEEQRELEKTLKEVDKAIINKYIIDSGNLRDRQNQSTGCCRETKILMKSRFIRMLESTCQ